MNKSNSLLYRLLVSLPMFCLLVALIVIARHQNKLVNNQQANQFTFQKESLLIKGVGSSDTILYKDMKQVECLDSLTFKGKPYNGEEYFNGDFVFKEIGDARCYFYPQNNLYVVITTPEKKYVINYSNIEKTKEFVKQLESQKIE